MESKGILTSLFNFLKVGLSFGVIIWYLGLFCFFIINVYVLFC